MEAYPTRPGASTPNDRTVVGPTPRDTAIRMLAAGLWPVPLYPIGVEIPGRDKLSEGKEPIGRAWGLKRNTADTLHRRFKEHPKAGIGVALGPGRGPVGAWLIDVEGDGPEAEASRARLFGGEVIVTLGWGSARGGHQLLIAEPGRLADLLKLLKGYEVKGGPSPGVYHLPEFPGLEIRFGGVKSDGTVKQVQSAYPPTVGTDGKPRKWNGVGTIAPAPEAFYQSLVDAAAEKTGERPAPPPKRSKKGDAPPGDRYSAAALERELNALESAPVGGRNDQLNRSAYNLGQLVGARALERSEVERVLTDTGERIGLERGEVLATVRSGLDAGVAEPRDLSGVGSVRRNGHTPHGANGDGHTLPPGPSAEAMPAAPTRFHLTDLGNAERLVAMRGEDLLHCHPWAKWLVWDGKRWALDQTAAVRRMAKHAVRSIYREASHTEDDQERILFAKWAKASEARQRIDALVTLASAEDGIPVLPEQLDQNPWLLNCQNGTLDLRSGVLGRHFRGDLITRLCPVAYDPKATCPHWEQTLAKVFAGSEELISFWRRLCGLCLTGVTSEQILPILHGAGSNGKSTLLGALLEMLGADYALKAPHDLLLVKGQSHPTERAALFGKRLVVAIETAEGSRLDEVMVKELTGGDTITARRMREDYWSFRPCHKLLLCTNHRPEVRGTDHAIWRRLLLVPFTVTITSDEAVKDMPELLAGEFPGILTWCVRGCLEWQKSGLNPPGEIDSATKDYREREDVLGAFLEEHCVCDRCNESLRVKATSLYERFRHWSETNGEAPANQRRFGMAITERGFKRLTNNGIWYLGIGLRQLNGEPA